MSQSPTITDASSADDLCEEMQDETDRELFAKYNDALIDKSEEEPR